MKRYKVTFIKVTKVIGTGQSQLLYLAEQTYLSDTDKFKIDCPEGYQVASVTEYLPDHIIKSDKKLYSA